MFTEERIVKHGPIIKYGPGKILNQSFENHSDLISSKYHFYVNRVLLGTPTSHDTHPQFALTPQKFWLVFDKVKKRAFC